MRYGVHLVLLVMVADGGNCEGEELVSRTPYPDDILLSHYLPFATGVARLGNFTSHSLFSMLSSRPIYSAINLLKRRRSLDVHSGRSAVG